MKLIKTMIVKLSTQRIKGKNKMANALVFVNIHLKKKDKRLKQKRDNLK